MIQHKIVKAYETTQELVENKDLTINAKWELFKLRKELLSCYEFYINESRDLLSKYKTEVNGNTISFESETLAKDYKVKQDEIDNFDVDKIFEKINLKLSDIPGITIPQMEKLDEFIEFTPE